MSDSSSAHGDDTGNPPQGGFPEQTRQPGEAERRRRAKGLTLAVAGAIGVVASLAVIVFRPGLRTSAMFTLIVFWVVWFTGKTFLKAK